MNFKTLFVTLPLAVLFTIVIACSPGANGAPKGRQAIAHSNKDLSSVNPAQTHLEIDKSDYELHLYEGETRLKSYPVVLGPNPIDDKMQQGDGCTPEGTFKIRARYPHDSWSHFLWIDYPNAASWKKFKDRKAKGKIPADAQIGGEIGIHGVPQGRDDILENGINWTLGCISVSNAHIQEIYPLVRVGTEVVIRK